MAENPTWLIEKRISLDDGSTARWSYDTESDMLEIFFGEGPATCTVELADGVFLRLDLNGSRALSLGFLSATPLTDQGEFGPPALPLDGLESLPPQLRQIVVQVITSQPVRSVFRVFSLLSSPQAEKAVPVASLDRRAA